MVAKSLAALLVLLLVLPAAAEDPPAKDDLEKNTEITTASEDALKELIATHKDAVKTKDADLIRKSLEKLYAYDNEKIKEVVDPLLKYKLSPVDKKAIAAECRSRGIRKPKSGWILTASTPSFGPTSSGSAGAAGSASRSASRS